MEERIRAQGITTMRELCSLSRERMHNLWVAFSGSSLALAQGRGLPGALCKAPPDTQRQHMLPPDCRTPNAHGAS